MMTHIELNGITAGSGKPMSGRSQAGVIGQARSRVGKVPVYGVGRGPDIGSEMNGIPLAVTVMMNISLVSLKKLGEASFMIISLKGYYIPLISTCKTRIVGVIDHTERIRYCRIRCHIIQIYFPIGGDLDHIP
jgi:hypothetical protein